MDGVFDFFNFLLLITILIIVIITGATIKYRTKKIVKDIELINKKLTDIVVPGSQEIKTRTAEVIPPTTTKAEEREIVPEPEPKPISIPEPEPVPVTLKTPVIEQKKEHHVFQSSEPVSTNTQKRKTNHDLEKFIGENLLSKIGILVLVLGIGYFVKYAIDQNWINEYGRVGIGILTGGILMGIAHWLRKSYKTFSSILTGGGIAVLYITISIAFHEYQIFSQTTAFVLLVVITIFSVLLSLLYDKKELAIFSQLGGFLAPFMVSTGEGNYNVLFVYILILNTGLLVLAYYKRWHILNLLAFIFTLIIYNSWLYSKFDIYTPEPYRAALLYAALFYLVFFLVNILNNIKERKSFNGIEIGMILSNNLLFFVSGLYILDDFREGALKGLFTVLVGLYNFGWVLYLYRRNQIDKTLIYLLIGIVMSYISLAIPIQLQGHSITLFWSAEIVILLWLSQKSGIKLLKTGHLIIIGLTAVSLIMDWFNLYIYGDKILPVIANQAFITGLIVISAFGLSIYLLRWEKEESFIKNLIKVNTYRNLLTGIIFMGLYVVLLAEINFQMNRLFESTALNQTVYALFNFTYLSLFLILCNKLKWETIIKVLYIPSLLLLLVFIFYYISGFIGLRNSYMLDESFKLSWFNFHYLVYLPVAWIVWFVWKNRYLLTPESKVFPNIILWFLTFFIVLSLSIELDNLMVVLSKPGVYDTYEILDRVHKVGYPILWSVCAFILIFSGIQYKNKILRIQAICLIGLILLKLIVFDVWDMNAGGRIAAFIFLGAILLIISFLYQKLKRFILVEEEKEKLS